MASILANGKAACASDNYALLDLASLICPARKPLCHQCPLVSECITGSRFVAESVLLVNADVRQSVQDQELKRPKAEA